MQAICTAFLALVGELGYEAVTVEAILERAEISRATFYAHYACISEVLEALMRDLIDELAQEVEPRISSGPTFDGEGLKMLLEHADRHRQLYRVILDGAGDGHARRAYVEASAKAYERVFWRVIENVGAQPRLDPRMVARSWIGTFCEVVDWWLCEAPQLSATEVAPLMAQLLFRGPMWLLGLEGRLQLVGIAAAPEDA